jgi:hypothetical protein
VCGIVNHNTTNWQAVDNSLVEVYANDVFALATHIYPWASDANQIWAWSNGSDNRFSSVQVWDGLASVSLMLALLSDVR